MKKYLLLIAITFLQPNFFSVKAQTYYPYVDTNKVWSIYWDYSAEGCPWLNYTYYIKFSGDTNINGKNYNQVKRSNDSLQVSWFNSGYIRETLDKKVYYILNSSDTTEKLFYDFDVSIGDTLQSYNCPVIINNIDSVLIGNHYRKRVNYDGYTAAWIEGIGSLKGFGTEGICVPWVGGIRTLLCFTENDTLKYTDPYYSFCYHGTLSINGQGKLNDILTIFPNPASDHITLKFSQDTNATIKIYNLLGELKYNSIMSSPETTIDIADLAKGVYIVEVVIEKNIMREKFIKQ